MIMIMIADGGANAIDYLVDLDCLFILLFLLDPILCELIFISFMSFVSLIALDSHMCSELSSLDVLVCQSTIFQFQSTVLMSKFKGTI